MVYFVSQKKEMQEILLYRQILSGDASKFAENAQSANGLIVRMHCIGGSVLDGIAIANTVSRLKNTTCIIEGVAASIGAVIACNFETTKIRKSARIMIHEIKLSNKTGNANDMREAAKEIDKNNAIIAEMIAKKAGKTVEYVIENWMKPNTDLWFSADEALKAGLVDEIIADNEVMNNSLSNEELINFFNNNLNQKPTNMEQMTALLGVIGIDDFKGTEQQAVVILQTELNNRATRIQELENKVASFVNAELTALMDAKRIPTKDRKTYTDIADKMGVDTAKAILNNVTNPVIALEGARKEEKTYQQWEKEDPKGLLEMMRNEPERYNALLASY